MTKAELTKKVLAKLDGYNLKQTEIIVDIFFDSIKEVLKKGERVELRRFGIFKIKKRKVRISNKLNNSKIIEKKVIYFKPSKELKRLVNSCKGGQARTFKKSY